jgi:hypothetical protein
MSANEKEGRRWGEGKKRKEIAVHFVHDFQVRGVEPRAVAS